MERKDQEYKDELDKQNHVFHVTNVASASRPVYCGESVRPKSLYPSWLRAQPQNRPASSWPSRPATTKLLKREEQMGARMSGSAGIWCHTQMRQQNRKHNAVHKRLYALSTESQIHHDQARSVLAEREVRKLSGEKDPMHF